MNADRLRIHMKEFHNATRENSRNWDASGMPGMMPPDFNLSADAQHPLGPEQHTWKVDTRGLVSMSDRNKSIPFPMKNNQEVGIDPKMGLEMGTETGTVSISSESVLTLSGQKRTGNTFQSHAPAPLFHYHLDPQKGYQITYKGPKVQERPIGAGYSMRSELIDAGPKLIDRKLSLHTVGKQHDHRSVNLDHTQDRSHTQFGGGFSGEGSYKQVLQVKLDGEDVLLLLNGQSKKLSKAQAQEDDILNDLVGGYGELLKKQKVSVDIDGQAAAHFGFHSGYEYDKQTTEIQYDKVTQQFSTAGEVAEEHHLIKILDEKQESEQGFIDKEGQIVVSEDDQEKIIGFLKKNALLMRQVKSGTHKIKISGFASSSGSEATNIGISQRRADALRSLVLEYDSQIDVNDGFTYEIVGEAKATQGRVFDKDRRVKIEFVRVR